MRKFLRFLLILVLLILVIVVIAGIMAPKEMNITSTIDINAPKEQVWEQMVILKNNKNWSSFTEQEPGIALTYSGTDGQPGSAYHWKGEKMGEGSCTIKSINGTTLNYDLAFVEPFKGVADGTMSAEDAGNGVTKATWTFHSVNDKFFFGAIGEIMSWFSPMQKTFDKGMQNLKAYVESHKSATPAAAAPATVQETQFPARTYAGVRKKVKEQDYQVVFNEIMGKVQSAAGGRINGPSVSIIYHWDSVTHEADMFAGFPISDDKPVPGATLVKVPASRAYLVAHPGDPAKTHSAHAAIGAHMAAKNEKETLVIEEYITAEEKDLNKWVTNVYYLVK